MNVLITGGTGLIGQALIPALLTDGHKVSVLTRSPAKVQVVLPPEVTAIQWDGRSTDGWAYVIEGTDAVINLAGENIAGDSLYTILAHRWTPAQKRRIQTSRVNAGRALVEAIAAADKKPEVLIQSSAVGYYGPQGDELILEQSPGGEDFLAEIVQAWEASTAEVEQLGLRRAIIRTGLVLAPQGGILPIMLLPFRLYSGGPLGSGKQFLPWIHIRDEVDAIRFLLGNTSTQGIYNLSAPNPVSSTEFGSIAGKEIKRPSWLRVPGFILKLALGEKSTLVLDGQRALPQRLLDAGYAFTFPNLDTALQDLI
jgi:uncharacterized protein